jgi:DNA-directed RNA polymerase specialized sigma24 family protein
MTHPEDAEPCRDALALELFRRAICDADSAAWEAIITQYRGLVRGWVRQHPAAGVVVENDDDRVARTFERFWCAVGPERLFQFTNLSALMGYLKLCVHSVIVDDARRNRMGRNTPLDTSAEVVSDSASVEDDVLGNMLAQDVWELILQLLPDATERMVAELSFIRGMAPRDIQALNSHRFATVSEVYRIKRSLMERLRRSPQLVRQSGTGHARSTRPFG